MLKIPTMKRLLLLLAAGVPGLWAAAAPGNPALVQNQVVYLLPMSGGFEQYLATELVRNNLVTVTTDPRRATAILTDRLGESLERKMKEFYEQPARTAETDKEKDKNRQDIKSNSTLPVSAFGGGKGTVYLIEASSRKVLWSTFARPKRTTPEEMTRTANKITHQLMKDSTPAALPTGSH